MDFARNRLRLAVVLTTLVALALATGLSVTGGFRADISTKRGLLGPVHVGVDGGVGKAEPAGGAPVQAPLFADPQPPLMMTSGGKYPLTITSAPYNGPTDEERALLHELRAVLKANFDRQIALHNRQVAKLSPEERQMVAPFVPAIPDVKLPPRHLTPYEMQEIRNSINTLKGSQ